MSFNQGTNGDIQNNQDPNDAINLKNNIQTNNLNVGSAVDINIQENDGETAEKKNKRTLSPTNKEEHLRASRKAQLNKHGVIPEYIKISEIY